MGNTKTWAVNGHGQFTETGDTDMDTGKQITRTISGNQQLNQRQCTDMDNTQADNTHVDNTQNGAIQRHGQYSRQTYKDSTQVRTIHITQRRAIHRHRQNTDTEIQRH
jgi:hypothetical protein